jgi:hypothetical protein
MDEDELIQTTLNILSDSFDVLVSYFGTFQPGSLTWTQLIGALHQHHLRQKVKAKESLFALFDTQQRKAVCQKAMLLLHEDWASR